MLTAREGPGFSVSVPAHPVVVDARLASEVDAAVAAALDNVAKHAGPGARARVLLEGDSAGIDLTIRDNGSGAELADLLTASERGRMGVSTSCGVGSRTSAAPCHVDDTRRGGGCIVRMTRWSPPRPGAPMSDPTPPP